MEPSSSFLASIARCIGDATLAEKHEALKQEASLPDLPEELADDEDSDDDGPWEYDWCPTAEVRRDDLEGAVAARYDDSGDGLDAVAHFAARLAVACGPVAGARRSVARFFLDRETARYRRRLARGRTRLDAAAAAGNAAPSTRAATAAARAYLSRRFPRAASWREARADASFLRDCAGAVGAVVFVRGAAVFGDARTLRAIAVARFRRKLGAALRRAAAFASDDIERETGVAAAVLDAAAAAARRRRSGGRLRLAAPEDVFAARDAGRFPPCFARMTREVRAAHHLKHDARFQYTCFLRALGAPPELVVALFEAELPRRPRDAAYRVRHAYGLEGGLTAYAPAKCATMIARRGQPHGAPGAVHDCPFRWDPDVAETLRGDLRLGDGDVAAVLAAASPRAKCAAAFAAVHGGDAGDPFHAPTDWVDASLDARPDADPRDDDDAREF